MVASRGRPEAPEGHAGCRLRGGLAGQPNAVERPGVSSFARETTDQFRPLCGPSSASIDDRPFTTGSGVVDVG